jgi:hypothetical protein
VERFNSRERERLCFGFDIDPKWVSNVEAGQTTCGSRSASADVEDLLAEHGIVGSYEAVRRGVNPFASADRAISHEVQNWANAVSHESHSLARGSQARR